MSANEGLDREIELLREKLNRSITKREDLKESYEQSVELDKLMEQYIQREKEKGK